ncbi:Unknown protein, partial [Striga hermonthica]
VKICRSDSTRLYVTCVATDCLWKVHLIKKKNEETWFIKEFFVNILVHLIFRSE